MTKRKYAQCGGIHGDIFNVASATIHPVRRGLLSNEFALSIIYYTNVHKKEVRNVIKKEGYLSAQKKRKRIDRCLTLVSVSISWQAGNEVLNVVKTLLISRLRVTRTS